MPATSRGFYRYHTGFTLVELVIVLVLLALSVGFLSRLLGNVSALYLAEQSRAALLDQSRFVLERISRELRDATPNSVRVSNSASYSCLEFVPFAAAGRYRELAQWPDQATSLDVVALKPGFTAKAAQWLLVYPQQAADIYQTPAGGQGARVQLANPPLQDDADGLAVTFRLLFSQAFGFNAGSPVRRFYLLDEPVSFCAQDRGIWRYQGYGLQSDQPVPGAGLSGGEQLASELANPLASQPLFQLAGPALTRSALVQLDLMLQSAQDPDVQLDHSFLVQVSNVP